MPTSAHTLEKEIRLLRKALARLHDVWSDAMEDGAVPLDPNGKDWRWRSRMFKAFEDSQAALESTGGQTGRGIK